MADATLEKATHSDLRAELDMRAKVDPKSDAKAMPATPLAAHSTTAIAKAMIAQEKVIYGVDDRKDYYDFPSDKVRQLADSVVALFEAADITDRGDGTSQLVTQSIGDQLKLCPNERFRDQPTGAFCSGFLVGEDLVATAGHCVNSNNVSTIRFVFGFRMKDANTAVTVIPNGEIYAGKTVVGRVEKSAGADWSLVRLDRKVTGHKVLKIRRTGRIADHAPVSVIGHPSGLPIKFADGATVRDNSPSGFFVANLDTYGGNSGSPVFAADGTVEGVLVRGDTDYVMVGNCRVSKVCPTTGCRGEDCTRVTELADKVP